MANSTCSYRHEQQPTGRTDVQIDIEREPRRRYRDNYREEVTYDRENAPRDTQLDITERSYRERIQPSYEKDYRATYDVEYERRAPAGRRVQFEKDSTYDVEYSRTRPGREHVHAGQDRVVDSTTEVVIDKATTEEEKKMGYYDDQGQYHSFRRGLERAADRLVHPLSGGHHHGGEVREEITVEERSGPSRGNVRLIERERSANTVTIPCHHIRIGDLLILQGRPCQVIRITTSAQTGQHRYLGVDLFTKQLHEESSFVANPEPSVVVQTMLGPVFKEYRVLDIRRDGRVVAMTETGDVKQGLPVIDQNQLYERIDDAFGDGRGSVRVLVINDGGRELAVDYKVIHGSRL